jgi:hypothetical protein
MDGTAAERNGYSHGDTSPFSDEEYLQELPPRDLQAEQAVLGSMLQDNGVIQSVRSTLEEGDFYFDHSQRIFRAICSLADRGNAVDLVILGNELKRCGAIEDIGGYGYLAELWTGAFIPANVQQYANIVHGHSTRRKVILETQRLQADLLTGRPVGDIVDEFETSLHAIGSALGMANKLVPIPTSALKATDPGRLWLWHGCIAREGATLLTAFWKAGKTTLLSLLLRVMECGGLFCEREVAPCCVLYITEESEGLWAERRDELGIGDHVSFLIRPFVCKPDAQAWKQFIKDLNQLRNAWPAELIVLDTLANLWPVREENNASEVQAALMPLRQLTAAGAALLLSHHPRKTEGHETVSARGSGALSAWADILLDLRQPHAADKKDRTRILSGLSRFSGVPQDLVIQLSEDGTEYLVEGTRNDLAKQKLLTSAEDLLPIDTPGFTIEEILDRWESPAPGKAALTEALRAGVDQKRLHREGEGKRGSPYRYRRA